MKYIITGFYFNGEPLYDEAFTLGDLTSLLVDYSNDSDVNESTVEIETYEQK